MVGQVTSRKGNNSYKRDNFKIKSEMCKRCIESHITFSLKDVFKQLQ